MGKILEKRLQILDLNSTNVLSLYKDCLITKEDLEKNPNDALPVKIFDKESCGKDSPEFVFDKSYIETHYKSILFLLSQLKVTHEHKKAFGISAGNIKYTGKPWTDDSSTLFALYYLGVAAHLLPKFRYLSEKLPLVSSVYTIAPNVSPGDPRFKAPYNKDPNAYNPPVVLSEEKS